MLNSYTNTALEFAVSVTKYRKFLISANTDYGKKGTKQKKSLLTLVTNLLCNYFQQLFIIATIFIELEARSPATM